MRKSAKIIFICFIVVNMVLWTHMIFTKIKIPGMNIASAASKNENPVVNEEIKVYKGSIRYIKENNVLDSSIAIEEPFPGKNFSNPQFFSDGKIILVEEALEMVWNPSEDIWYNRILIIDLDTLKITPLTEKGCGRAALSPDENYIAYEKHYSIPQSLYGPGTSSQEGGSHDVWIMTVDGNDKRALTSDKCSFLPSWSSDGKWIYFKKGQIMEGDSGFKPGPESTWKVSKDGEKLSGIEPPLQKGIVITEPGVYSNWEWQIFYKKREIARSSTYPQIYMIHGYEWGPQAQLTDNKHIVVTRYDDESKKISLVLISLDNLEEIQLDDTLNTDSYLVASCENYIAYVNSKGRLCLVNTKNLEKREILQFDPWRSLTNFEDIVEGLWSPKMDLLLIIVHGFQESGRLFRYRLFKIKI